jgi:hypothetical protein
MLPQEIIRRKRDGEPLSPSEIAAFVAGLTDGSFTDAQVSALAMAVFLKGMERDEAVALTLAMRDSGDRLDWSDLPGPVTDKHSTGGVGDNVSLMLAPIVAACGAYVPMISGRGLGHTGGTLDKMDSIPGYVSQPDNTLFARTVRECGCAIIGQTARLAPADRRFYAIRDVTATVESIPLITASILSKKLAAGLGSLVLDVKVGNGAFMAKAREASNLARSLVETAVGAGLPASALMTDMNEPLASAAGNAVEVLNAADFLTGRHRDRAWRKSRWRSPPKCWFRLAGRSRTRMPACAPAMRSKREGRPKSSAGWWPISAAPRISSNAIVSISKSRRWNGPLPRRRTATLAGSTRAASGWRWWNSGEGGPTPRRTSTIRSASPGSCRSAWRCAQATPWRLSMHVRRKPRQPPRRA